MRLHDSQDEMHAYLVSLADVLELFLCIGLLISVWMELQKEVTAKESFEQSVVTNLESHLLVCLLQLIFGCRLFHSENS